jgi:uncharacterized membrane protein YgcG
MKVAWAALALAIAGSVARPGHADTVRGHGSLHVLDPAGALRHDEIDDLDARFEAIRHEHGVGLLVFVVPSLDAEPIDAFARRTFEGWRPVDLPRERRILLVIALHERSARVVAASEHDAALDSEELDDLTYAHIAPALLTGRTADAIRAGAHALEAHLLADTATAQTATVDPPSSRLQTVVVLTLGAAMAAFVVKIVRDQTDRRRASGP